MFRIVSHKMRQLTVCTLLTVIYALTTYSLECYNDQDIEWDIRKEEPKTNYLKFGQCSGSAVECIAIVKPVREKPNHWMFHVGCGSRSLVNTNDSYFCETHFPDVYMCYCSTTHCNDFTRLLTYLRKSMPTTTALSTTTMQTTTTTVAPAKCYEKNFVETTLKQIPCEAKRCFFMTRYRGDELMVQHGCMDGQTDNKLVFGCHTVTGDTGEGWGCFCYSDLCNSEEWVMAEIQKHEDEQKFGCFDYSTTKMNTSLPMEKVECEGPRQCTSYFQAVDDGLQYEGGCVDGLISDAFYEEDCFFDEEYPNGPVFVCYCNKAMCNSITNFNKLAKSKNAYDWARKHRNGTNCSKIIHPALILSLYIFWRLIFYD